MRTTTSTTARGGGRRAVAGNPVLATCSLSIGLVADARRGSAPTKRVVPCIFAAPLRGAFSVVISSSLRSRLSLLPSRGLDASSLAAQAWNALDLPHPGRGEGAVVRRARSRQSKIRRRRQSMRRTSRGLGLHAPAAQEAGGPRTEGRLKAKEERRSTGSHPESTGKWTQLQMFPGREVPAVRRAAQEAPVGAACGIRKNGKWASPLFPGRVFDDLDAYRAAKKQRSARREEYLAARRENPRGYW